MCHILMFGCVVHMYKKEVCKYKKELCKSDLYWGILDVKLLIMRSILKLVSFVKTDEELIEKFVV